MTDPSPDKGREESGDDPGRPALPLASLTTRVPPGSPQPDRERKVAAPDTHHDDATLDMDGDRTLPSHPSDILSAEPGLTPCASRKGATAVTPSGAEGASRADRLDPDEHSSSENVGVTSDRSGAPLVDDESDLHAALVDDMKAHPCEGPLDSWPYSI
ncbi:unnamed protein product [Hyaloperonospora brassicae]|uniref:RxLR effector candidate protein n=1 Tax=Hyaloperonospora brassicae TaxID=162125 RepID=A0AAV0U0N9_HYABA|nr:unnamed protein product [Hyaloperonospora brassicae]